MDTCSALAVCLAFFVAFLVLQRRNTRGGPLPPGPPGLPIIGNILPQDQPWEAIRQYSLKYGSVIRLQVLCTRIIVINTVAAASELFENRSAIYSQRTALKMAVLCGMDDGILFESNVARLRQARKLVASGISPRELDKYRGQLRAHVLTLLEHLLHTPEQFLDHVRHLPGSIMLEVTYGYKNSGIHDPFIVSAETWVDNFAKATFVSKYLVNWMPILAYVPSWLPGAGFQKTAAAWKKQALDFGEEAYQFVANGVATPSVVSKALESKDLYEKHVILKSATQMVSGAADTTVSATWTFILAMVLHPEIQRKAQTEIDQIVGKDRLPAYSDRANLPFIEALIREVLRWRPPVPMVNRNLTKEDHYDGYYIPQDSFVLINFWAMLHNEVAFPEPDTFDPDRWMHGNIVKETDPLYVVFGFGRRECPGKYLAIELFFTTITGILAIFDISKAKDEYGNLITPTGKFTSGSISAPVPFKCSIKPRSRPAVYLLQENLDEVRR